MPVPNSLLRDNQAPVVALQANGVKAEFYPRACPSLNEQYGYANGRGIRWLLLLDGQPDARPTSIFRIKSLDGKVEASMALGDIPRHLASLARR